MTMKAAENALKVGMLRPEFFMKPTVKRCWIPMRISPEEALKRGLWGAEELEEVVSDPKKDLVVVEIVFTAHGVGYFHTMKKLLTTYNGTEYWKAWRFPDNLPYDNLPYSICSEKGDILVQLTTQQIA